MGWYSRTLLRPAAGYSTRDDKNAVSAKTIANPSSMPLPQIAALLPHIVSSFPPSLAGGLGSFPAPAFSGLALTVVKVARNAEVLTLNRKVPEGDTGGFFQ